MYFRIILLVLCLIFCVTVDGAEDNLDILCSEGFCEDYIKKNPCPKLPDNCKYQNSTHNGLFMPFDGPCNCCQYCVKNLDLGDSCVVGSPDGPVPNVICGDGLYCDKDKTVCISNPTPCIKEQEKFDEDKKNGILGHLQVRPECDKRGHYEPLRCTPGEICFCVDKNGNRIFGDIPYTLEAADRTKCECSRVINDINDVLGSKNYSPRRPKCLSDGNFNSIQCVSKQCICVNEVDGSPVKKDEASVNINLVSEMKCYNEQIHSNGSYYNNCERIYLKQLEQIETFQEQNYVAVGFSLPDCQLDGNYAAVQKNETMAYCADPNGNLIENFVINLSDSFNMNCYCARARSIIQFDEKPICCTNGNYECIQCRRGKCRCVDTNGLQQGLELDISEKNKLVCKNCANKCTI